MGTVCFGNDNFAAITGYRDYVQGNLTICHMYCVEGLGHNLFSVGQFCDGDLEVAFRSNTCYIRNLEGEDLLTSSRDSNLYTISISKMAASSLVCLMSKTTSIKSWLWHRRLSHLNFGTINQLTKNELVDGHPRFKYNKEHLCSACEQGKSKKATFPSKLVPSTDSKLELLHMDLYGAMRIQRNMTANVLKVRYDNETEFKNAILKSFYEKQGIMHHTPIVRMPQQNGVPVLLKIPLLYLTNDHDDLRKMRPKADIGCPPAQTRCLFSLSSTALSFLPAITNCLNFQNSSDNVNETPSQQDLDNLFGPLYEEYYAPRTLEVSDNFATNTLDNDDTSSSSLIIIEDNDAP
ncbi:retrovirus-related pol polyprotein from transposon TNT 1-94 [Tanacetum coccineum]